MAANNTWEVGSIWTKPANWGSNGQEFSLWDHVINQLLIQQRSETTSYVGLIKQMRIDKDRLEYCCTGIGCNFKFYMRKVGATQQGRLKKVNLQHSCQSGQETELRAEAAAAGGGEA